MRELNVNEIQEVNGGECVYADQSYSTGAELPNGQVCQADGSWSQSEP